MSEAKQFACLASADIGLASLMFYQGRPFIGAYALAVGVLCGCLFAIKVKRVHHG
jgi:xanthine/uracil permease